MESERCAIHDRPRAERRALEEETKQLDAYEQKYSALFACSNFVCLCLCLFRFWEEYQEFQMQLDAISAEQNSVKQSIKVATERLERCVR